MTTIRVHSIDNCDPNESSPRTAVNHVSHWFGFAFQNWSVGISFLDRSIDSDQIVSPCPKSNGFIFASMAPSRTISLNVRIFSIVCVGFPSSCKTISYRRGIDSHKHLPFRWSLANIITTVHYSLEIERMLFNSPSTTNSWLCSTVAILRLVLPSSPTRSVGR